MRRQSNHKSRDKRDEARNQRMLEASRSWKMQKQILPRAPWGNISLPSFWFLTKWNQFWSSGLQNWEIKTLLFWTIKAVIVGTESNTNKHQEQERPMLKIHLKTLRGNTCSDIWHLYVFFEFSKQFWSWSFLIPSEYSNLYNPNRTNTHVYMLSSYFHHVLCLA